MGRVCAAILAVLAVIYIVPFLVYGAFSAAGAVEAPKGASPAAFLVSVLVSKIGTAAAFVLLLRLAWEPLAGRWKAYCGVWWGMYLIGEIGQAIGPNYGWMEAAAGAISETIYFPLSGLAARSLLRKNQPL